MTRVLIMGAAGRDFHNFNVVYRGNPEDRVVAFTATQIPGIASRRYPSVLAGPGYPEGIPIHPEEKLQQLIRDLEVEEVVFSYSDVPHQEVMHKASQVLAAGADFRLLGPRSTCLKSRLPVVAVCSVRTGAGKSQTTRKVAAILKARGHRVAVIRHPMPYGELEQQKLQRFETLEDLRRHRCTLEEWEEYAPHIEEGHLVFAGVDYQSILEEAEQEADVLLWDGGNNDLPFYRPDLHICLADPHRVGHETSYHPGEANLRMADLVIINKVDSASREQLHELRANVARVNPRAAILEAASTLRVEEGLDSKKVLVVEDGPTLTHGEMPFGAGLLVAHRHGCEVVDPRPFAVGSLKALFEQYPHLGPVLPAMGYSEAQRSELEQTINAAPVEAVVIGTPIDLGSVIKLRSPGFRVRYDFQQTAGPDLESFLSFQDRP